MTFWRRLTRAMARFQDRFRHEARRGAAADLLRSGGLPRSVLVVCHGNLCRSPYAAAALRRRAAAAGLDLHVESAGFSGPGRAAPSHALASAAHRGEDLSAHRSRMVDRLLLDSADLIVVMEPSQADAVVARYSATRRVLILGDLDPAPATTREIVDPFGRARADFDECYDRIDRCVDQLVRLLAEPGQRGSGSGHGG